MRAYLRDAEEITRRSFEVARRETDLSAIPDDLTDIALRLVHATAMPELVRDLRFSPGAGTAGQAALLAGAPIVADCKMVADGIRAGLVAGRNEIICALDGPGTAAYARERGTTRAAAGIALARIDGGVIAIGNAPTALFALLDEIEDGAGKPALILGFPVGFIGAAESKQALAEADIGVPFITLAGRFGGSALAAAAVNALLIAIPAPVTVRAEAAAGAP
ncbi:MAG: precorrin-8X methylmutase [Proteobacteria bacterium]|nr:precorrin-8X methylmutase [Pseudomonadota bacterium]